MGHEWCHILVSTVKDEVELVRGVVSGLLRLVVADTDRVVWEQFREGGLGQACAKDLGGVKSHKLLSN